MVQTDGQQGTRLWPASQEKFFQGNQNLTQEIWNCFLNEIWNLTQKEENEQVKYDWKCCEFCMSNQCQRKGQIFFCFLIGNVYHVICEAMIFCNVRKVNYESLSPHGSMICGTVIRREEIPVKASCLQYSVYGWRNDQAQGGASRSIFSFSFLIQAV